MYIYCNFFFIGSFTMASRNRTTPTAACPRWCPSVRPRRSSLATAMTTAATAGAAKVARTACWTRCWSRSCSWNGSSRRARPSATMWVCTRNWWPWPRRTGCHPNRYPGRKCVRPRKSPHHHPRHYRHLCRPRPHTGCHPDWWTLCTKTNPFLRSKMTPLVTVTAVTTVMTATKTATTTFSRKGANRYLSLFPCI